MYIHRTTYLLVEGHDAGYHRIPVPAIRLLLLLLLAFLLHSSTRQLLSKASVDCEQTRELASEYSSISILNKAGEDECLPSFP